MAKRGPYKKYNEINSNVQVPKSTLRSWRAKGAKHLRDDADTEFTNTQSPKKKSTYMKHLQVQTHQGKILLENFLRPKNF